MLKAISHYLAGRATPLFLYIHPPESTALTVLAWGSFMLYEFDQDWSLKDGAYKDIKEYSIGFYTVSIILLFLVLFKTY